MNSKIFHILFIFPICFLSSGCIYEEKPRELSWQKDSSPPIHSSRKNADKSASEGHLKNPRTTTKEFSPEGLLKIARSLQSSYKDSFRMGLDQVRNDWLERNPQARTETGFTAPRPLFPIKPEKLDPQFEITWTQAAKGEPDSLLKLAKAYSKGQFGLSTDIIRSNEIHSYLASKGVQESLIHHAKKLLGTKKEDEALRLLLPYFKDRPIAFEFAQILRLHYGDEENLETGFKIYRILARGKHPQACYHTANMALTLYKGTLKNDLILHYIGVAMEAEVPEAYLLMAGEYLSGKLLQRNETRAFELYQAAAGKKLQGAMKPLAKMYEEGKIIQRDPNMAYIFYQTSHYGSFAGDPEAKKCADRLFPELTTKEKSTWKAQVLSRVPPSIFALAIVTKMGFFKSSDSMKKVLPLAELLEK